MSHPTSPPQRDDTSAKSEVSNARAKKLAAKLRENLKRRKESADKAKD
jgi:hypothetical protein